MQEVDPKSPHVQTALAMAALAAPIINYYASIAVSILGLILWRVW